MRLLKENMNTCTLCPRRCGADRAAGEKGRCHTSETILVARAALHYWEEPCLSGQEGSGAVFFSGCPLGCIYCQNREISRGEAGLPVTIGRLSKIFLELQDQNANNINLVTAGHYLPQVCEALRLAKQDGLCIPVVWNSSAYETVEALKMLQGLVDVYLPDLKYLSPELAARYSHAPDYPEVAREAIGEMVRQQPVPRFDSSGRMTAGVIVRHLLLPGHVREAKKVLQYLHETYKDQIYISIMSQYTPPDVKLVPEIADDPLICRKVTRREYERLLAYATQIGISQGFYQEGETAEESFIPPFDGTGVGSQA